MSRTHGHTTKKGKGTVSKSSSRCSSECTHYKWELQVPTSLLTADKCTTKEIGWDNALCCVDVRIVFENMKGPARLKKREPHVGEHDDHVELFHRDSSFADLAKDVFADVCKERKGGCDGNQCVRVALQSETESAYPPSWPMWYNCSGPECPGGPKHQEFIDEMDRIGEEEEASIPRGMSGAMGSGVSNVSVGMAAGGLVGAAVALVWFGVMRRRQRPAAKKGPHGDARRVGPAASGLETR